MEKINEKKAARIAVSLEQREGEPRVTTEQLAAGAADAGWSDDPGTGRAYLIPDSRGNPAYEVLNPMPFAPPIGFEPTPPIDQLIRDRVAAEVARLRDDEEIDDILDAEDFDVPDEIPPLETIYEFIAMEHEAPKLPKDSKADLTEAVKAEVEFEEMKERERLLRKRHREAAAKKAQDELDELYSQDRPVPPPGSAKPLE